MSSKSFESVAMQRNKYDLILNTPEGRVDRQEPEAVAATRKEFEQWRGTFLTEDRKITLFSSSEPLERFVLHQNPIKTPEGYKFIAISYPGDGNEARLQVEEKQPGAFSYESERRYHGDQFEPHESQRFHGDQIQLLETAYYGDSDESRCVPIVEDINAECRAMIDMRCHGIFLYDTNATDYYSGLHCLYSPLEPVNSNPSIAVESTLPELEDV